MAPGAQRLHLRQGPLELQWLPAAGACCAALRHHGAGASGPTDILRPLPAGATDPFFSGCFALLPYSNRLFGQVLMNGAQDTHTIALNRAGQAHPVHGVGWMQAWQVQQLTENAIRLGCARDADPHWPWAHGAMLDIRLSDSTLRIDLTLHNRSDQAMPAGAGFHPWLVAEPDASLRFAAHSVWRKGADGWPKDCIDPALDARFDCTHWRSVHGLDLDHCYAGWAGQADLQRPSAGLAVHLRASADLGHLQVYRPPGQAWVCVEPVSHATGAFSLPALHGPQHGVRSLAPGASLHCGMEIGVSAL